MKNAKRLNGILILKDHNEADEIDFEFLYSFQEVNNCIGI